MNSFLLLIILLFKNLRNNVITLRPINAIISKRTFLRLGLFPICDHYYGVLSYTSYLKFSLWENQAIPGINRNLFYQLAVLQKFHYNQAVQEINSWTHIDRTFNFINGTYGSCDSEYPLAIGIL